MKDRKYNSQNVSSVDASLVVEPLSLAEQAAKRPGLFPHCSSRLFHAVFKEGLVSVLAVESTAFLGTRRMFSPDSSFTGKLRGFSQQSKKWLQSERRWVAGVRKREPFAWGVPRTSGPFCHLLPRPDVSFLSYTASSLDLTGSSVWLFLGSNTLLYLKQYQL